MRTSWLNRPTRSLCSSACCVLSAIVHFPPFKLVVKRSDHFSTRVEFDFTVCWNYGLLLETRYSLHVRKAHSDRNSQKKAIWADFGRPCRASNRVHSVRLAKGMNSELTFKKILLTSRRGLWVRHLMDGVLSGM